MRVHSHQRAHTERTDCIAKSTLHVSLPQLATAARVPNAPLSHHLPARFRALALFGRRSAQRVVRSVLPASENLRMSRREQVQQKNLFDHLVGDREQRRRYREVGILAT
jgi:hypothetical protein